MYAFEQDVPIDAAVYARITDGLGATPPDGLLAHIALERADGHLYYLDVWQSREDCDRFTDERLHAVVGPVLAGAGVRVDEEPARRTVTVVDLWGEAFPRRVAV